MSDLQALLPLNTEGVHPAWQARWAPAITNKRIRSEIVSNPRFAQRIITDFIGENEAETDSLKPDASVETIRALNTDAQLHRIGLLWLAPKLYRCLFDKSTRTCCGPITQELAREIQEFFNHIEPDKIARLPKEKLVKLEGRACIQAWLHRQIEPSIVSLRFKIDPKEVSATDLSNERAQFFTRFLEYTNHQDKN